LAGHHFDFDFNLKKRVSFPPEAGIQEIVALGREKGGQQNLVRDNHAGNFWLERFSGFPLLAGMTLFLIERTDFLHPPSPMLILANGPKKPRL
jgi:hypothetical protein